MSDLDQEFENFDSGHHDMEDECVESDEDDGGYDYESAASDDDIENTQDMGSDSEMADDSDSGKENETPPSLKRRKPHYGKVIVPFGPLQLLNGITYTPQQISVENVFLRAPWKTITKENFLVHRNRLNELHRKYRWPPKPAPMEDGRYICRNDMHPFSNLPWPLVIGFDDKIDTWHVKNVTFCSPNCRKRYIQSHNLNHLRQISLSLNRQFDTKVMGVDPFMVILAAPPIEILYLLNPLNGVSIEEYRRDFATTSIDILPDKVLSQPERMEIVSYAPSTKSRVLPRKTQAIPIAKPRKRQQRERTTSVPSKMPSSSDRRRVGSLTVQRRPPREMHAQHPAMAQQRRHKKPKSRRPLTALQKKLSSYQKQ